jgi:hypothetical protein
MTAHPNPPFDNFEAAFCHRYRCEPERFVRKVFFKSLPPFRLPVVLVFWILDRSLFDTDFDIIEALATTATREEFTAVLDELHNSNRVERSFLRRTLGVRVSGGQLLELRDEVHDLIAARAVVHPVSGPTKAVVAPAREPSSSNAMTLRKLRQAQTAIIDGQPLDRTLRSMRMTEAEFIDQLAEYSVGRPELAWLRTQLLRDRRLSDVERELDELKRELAERGEKSPPIP